MTPSDFAEKELEMWEQALREQREAESDLQAARASGPSSRAMELEMQLEGLRIRSDLLLAEAVKKMRTAPPTTTPGHPAC